MVGSGSPVYIRPVSQVIFGDVMHLVIDDALRLQVSKKCPRPGFIGPWQKLQTIQYQARLARSRFLNTSTTKQAWHTFKGWQRRYQQAGLIPGTNTTLTPECMTMGNACRRGLESLFHQLKYARSITEYLTTKLPDFTSLPPWFAYSWIRMPACVKRKHAVSTFTLTVRSCAGQLNSLARNKLIERSKLWIRILTAHVCLLTLLWNSN